jgi:hypothetical protein
MEFSLDSFFLKGLENMKVYALKSLTSIHTH